MSSQATHTLDVDVLRLVKLFVGGRRVEPVTACEVDVIMPSTEESIADVAE